MNADERASALLQLIHAGRDERQQALLQTARTQAAELKRQAHAQARQRVREALAAARTRLQAKVALAQAQQQTRQRLATQSQRVHTLAAALAQLPDALQRRWTDASAQALWISHAVDAAQRQLGGERWQIRCAPGVDAWPGNVPADADMVVDAGLRAGLRISAGANCVDATLAGLLADTDSVAALLLGALGASA